MEFRPDTTLTERPRTFTGIWPEPVDLLLRPCKDKSRPHLIQLAYFDQGRRIFPPPLNRSKWSVRCKGGSPCALENGDLMDGTYELIDRQGLLRTRLIYVAGSIAELGDYRKGAADLETFIEFNSLPQGADGGCRCSSMTEVYDKDATLIYRARYEKLDGKWRYRAVPLRSEVGGE